MLVQSIIMLVVLGIVLFINTSYVRKEWWKNKKKKYLEKRYGVNLDDFCNFR